MLCEADGMMVVRLLEFVVGGWREEAEVSEFTCWDGVRGAQMIWAVGGGRGVDEGIHRQLNRDNS